MAALRCCKTWGPQAIAEMVELIEKKMHDAGRPYVIDRNGNYQDIYFRADATLQFGYESGYDRDTMLRLCGTWRRSAAPASDGLDALLWRPRGR